MIDREATARERRAEAPLCTRAMIIQAGTINDEARTVEVVWSTGAPVRRRDWWSGASFIETLSLDPASVRLDRLNSGGAPVLPNHDSWDIDDQLGVVVAGSATVDGGEGRATLRFLSAGIDEDADRLWAKIKDGVITRVSVGYVVHVWNEVRQDGALVSREAADWEPYEISFVSLPADPQAGVRSEVRSFSCLIRALPASTEIDMLTNTDPAGGTAPAPETRAAPVGAPAPTPTPAAPAAIQAETVEQYRRAARGLGLTGDDAMGAMARGLSVEAWRAEVIDARAAEAERTAPVANAVPANAAGRALTDEGEVMARGMEEALFAQLSRTTPTDNGRRFMELRNLVDFAAERLGERRVPGGFGQREDLLRRAFHTTSDFPLLLENALNRSLGARYAMAQPTYRRIARQRSYQDFRDHSTVRVGDFPTLQPVSPNGGELKAGTFGESREKTAVSAYGVTVNLSRQLLVNDTLGGIIQVLNDRGAAVARFEEKTFYAMMISGSSSNGPTLLETSRQVFNTTDKSLAASPSTIDVTNLSLGRAALRKRTSLDGESLDINASVLLVGPDRETLAQSVVAPIQAQQVSNVNPFSGTLSVVTTAQITGNAWYMFADPAEAPCFEWGLLDGYTAPRFRMEEVFGRQGTQLSLEHDFGCGAIDFRGGYRNAGA